MIIPVRCFSCGKPVGHLYADYKKQVGNGKDSEKVLTKLGLKRYCCRQLFIGHVDVLEKVSMFKP